MLVILEFRKLRQEDLRFEASLKYLAASPMLVSTGLTMRAVCFQLSYCLLMFN
jgi:hypothetical protein